MSNLIRTHSIFKYFHFRWADTPGVQTAMPEFYNSLKNKLRSSDQGADTLFWLGGVSELPAEKFSGEFFRDRNTEIKHFCISSTRYKKEKAEDLWNWCAELSKENSPPTTQGKEETK